MNKSNQASMALLQKGKGQEYLFLISIVLFKIIPLFWILTISTKQNNKIQLLNFSQESLVVTILNKQRKLKKKKRSSMGIASKYCQGYYFCPEISLIPSEYRVKESILILPNLHAFLNTFQIKTKKWSKWEYIFQCGLAKEYMIHFSFPIAQDSCQD